MDKPIMSAGPHIHSADSSRRIMLDVILALLPASVAAVVLFGVQALWIILTCVISAVVSEFLFNLVTRREQSVGDLSAVVTGLLLALNLSTNVPLWQCALGSIFAIVLVKCAFGGMGHNVEGAALPTLGQMFLGLRGGAIGEGCIAALLVGFAYLLVRRVIHWQTPVIFIATVFLCYLIASGDFTVALYEVMAGGLVLGAVFMATDYTTTPITAEGRWLFALGCGLITFVIRRFCAYPEGVSYSILCMNILSPWLEKWTRRKPLGGV